MKSPLEQLKELEYIIRELHKIDSKLIAGQVILAYREIGRIIAYLERKSIELSHSEPQDASNITIKEVKGGQNDQ